VPGPCERIRPIRTVLGFYYLGVKARKRMHHILVIEDENGIRKVIEQILMELGYRVSVAEDGEKGLRLFKTHRDFDLVITDIRMPAMSGNEVAKYIKNSDNPDVPIVAMTGYPDEVHKEYFHSSITKPFNVHDLLEKIRSLEK
jgi:CheY-like chemotaxis protein